MLVFYPLPKPIDTFEKTLQGCTYCRNGFFTLGSHKVSAGGNSPVSIYFVIYVDVHSDVADVTLC